MAKALLGYRTATDRRLMLERLVARLELDNDRLRADLRRPDPVADPVPTIVG